LGSLVQFPTLGKHPSEQFLARFEFPVFGFGEFGFGGDEAAFAGGFEDGGAVAFERYLRSFFANYGFQL
jgi:hypothetical protein